MHKNTNCETGSGRRGAGGCGGGDYRACPWWRTHAAVRVCDRLEKEDKCWSVSEANGFLSASCTNDIRCVVRELKGEDEVEK